MIASAWITLGYEIPGVCEWYTFLFYERDKNGDLPYSHVSTHAYDMCLLGLIAPKGMLMNFQKMHFQVYEVHCGNLYDFLIIDALDISHNDEELSG